MPGNGCIVSSHGDKVHKAGNKFINSPEVKGNKDIIDPSGFVKEVFNSVFNLPFEYFNVISYNPGQVKTFENRLNQIRRAIGQGKLTGKFGEYLYNTSARAKLNPYANNLLNDLIDVSYNYKGRRDRHVLKFTNIVESLKNELKVEGFLSEGSKNWKAATKKANKFSEDIESLKLKADQGDQQAHINLKKLRDKENLFYAEGEGRIFGDFIDIIQNDVPKIAKSLEKDYYSKIREVRTKYEAEGMNYIDALNRARKEVKKDKFEENLNSLDLSAPMTKALGEYLELMNDMYHTLEMGVKAHVNVMREGMLAKGIPEAKIDKIQSSILSKAMPDYETGFYPHYRRDLNIDFMQNLMPKMQRISDSMTEYLTHPTKNVELMNKAIEDIQGYASHHSTGRQQNVKSENISRNFLSDIKRYIDEIDNFNYIAHADLKTRQALNQVKKGFREGASEGYGESVVRLMIEMNTAMKGKNTGFDNAVLENLTQSILGFEFVSKLGFNLRGALRNSTQWLLNVVEFGPGMMKKSSDFYKRHRETLYQDMVKARDKAGLEFGEGDILPELQEAFGAERKITDKLVYRGDKIEIKGTSPGDKIVSGIKKASGKSGIFMRAVENKNRRDTFGFAWYRMYDMLSKDSGFRDMLVKQGKSDVEIQREIKTKARRYAINMVTMLHFDYSAMSKNKYLRSPVGRVMGQFQHYGFKFLEYNMNLAKEGTNSVMAGRLNTPEAMKMYRMGLMYFIAPALLTSITGVDWGNLIEHDTKKRMEQLNALFLGSEEEQIKAFYGRGPLTGMIGAPALSDALALGNIFEWWDMDENSKLNLIAGYRDYADVSGDRKAYEIMRILNTSVGRGYYQTLPLLLSGKLGAAAQFEAGLYPTTKAKEYKNAAAKTVKKILPDDIQHAFDLLQKHKEEAKKNPF